MEESLDHDEPYPAVRESPVQSHPDLDHEGERIDNSSHEFPPTDLSSSTAFPALGARIEVLWPDDDAFYPGVIEKITDGGQHVVSYDDGEHETLKMAEENWRPCDTIEANFTNFPTLKSVSPSVLCEMHEALGNKPLLLNHGQSFPQYVMYSAYETEEAEFKKHVRCVPIASIPDDTNIISSHTVYKIKIEDDDSLRLKARIAPHGNEDKIKQSLKSDCAMCSPTGIRIFLSITAIRRWPLVKADVKAAFCRLVLPNGTYT